LIAEQYRDTRPYITTDPKTRERLIVDPAQTIGRIFLYFYFMINVGALIGAIAMVYAEKYVGFWLAYLLPAGMFALCPLVLFVCSSKYNLTPPTGSVVGKAFRLWTFAAKPHWSWNPVKLYPFLLLRGLNLTDYLPQYKELPRSRILGERKTQQSPQQA
jgi:POT family proton-dependent oligopeptide transporter